VGPIARDATIQIGVADPALATTIASAVTGALATLEIPELACPLVHLRSRKRLAALVLDGSLAGAIAIVGVTPRNARHLVTLIDGLRAAGAAGIQLVWDGDARDERHVFAALERARATPAAAPVVVATGSEPAPALRLLIAHRLRRST
jgi:hypothetical protein